MEKTIEGILTNPDQNNPEMIAEEFDKVYSGFDLDGRGSINLSEMYTLIETIFGSNYS
jgi:Ca2+-binding EF-hand superfamily protein